MPLRPLLVAACLAAAPLPVLAQAAEPSLVQVFADWYGRHPIGSIVAPSQTRPVEAARLGLPALPTGQRYVEFDGMIAKVDAAWKLLGLVRRAPTTEAAAPAPQAPAATAGATATATAEVNVTVVTGDAASEEASDDARILTIAEAEAQGIRIPGGHRPRAGECRIWIPGTPPGRQPRGPVDCGTGDLPPGAVLIRG